MNYKVPQFIEVEDKIFGPLTFKQFIYLGGGAGACFMLWTFLPGALAILLILPVAALALALAFWKVNGRPFVAVAESFLKYQLSGRLYLWRKNVPKVNTKQQAPNRQTNTNIQIPKLSQGRLRELAWSLDVNEHLNG